MIRNHVLKFTNLERAVWLQISPIRQHEHLTNKLIVVFDEMELTSNHHVSIVGVRADGTSLPKYETDNTNFDDIRLTKVILTNDLLDTNGNVLLKAGTVTYQFVFSYWYTIINGVMKLAIDIQHNYVVPGNQTPQYSVLSTAQFTMQVEPRPFSDLTYEGVIP